MNKSLLLTAILSALVACLAGCSSLPKITVPPGSLTSWTHKDNWGPVSTTIVLTGVVKNKDGTFTVANYDGEISYLGFGPHDTIVGLQIDATGQAIIPAK